MSGVLIWALSVTAQASPGFTNPGTVTISDPTAYSAVYALSDVHGMYKELQKLLTENGLMDTAGHWSGGKALLVVVGDSIDKGPQSVDVLDTWIRLKPEAQAAGGRLLVLLGNHEAEFLADPTPSDSKAKALFDELKTRGIKPEELSDPKYPRGQFLRGLPIAARVGDWLFAHAGYLPKDAWKDFTEAAAARLSTGMYGDDLVTGDNSILEAKKWWQLGSDDRAKEVQHLDRDGFAGVVFGHQPKALNISGAIARSEDSRLIKIDNGMAPEAGAHPGSLLLFAQPAELTGPSAARATVYALIGGKRKAPLAESRVEPTDAPAGLR